MTIVDRLRACWGVNPNVDRKVALVDGFLNGKTIAELAQEHRKQGRARSSKGPTGSWAGAS